MEQVEIVRATREIFEKTGIIPHPSRIDPSVRPAGITVVELANMMLETPWKDLPEEFRRLRGFFASPGLFRKTMLTGDLKKYVCFLHLNSYAEKCSIDNST